MDGTTHAVGARTISTIESEGICKVSATGKVSNVEPRNEPLLARNRGTNPAAWPRAVDDNSFSNVAALRVCASPGSTVSRRIRAVAT
jgi:hypothetical protein